MARKYDALQWLILQVANVGPAFGNFTHFNMFTPKAGNEYSFSRYRSEMKRLYELLEKRLGQVPYLGGDEYSIATLRPFPGRATTTLRACAGRTTRTWRAGSMPLRSGLRSRLHWPRSP